MKNVLTILLTLILTLSFGCSFFNSAVQDPALQDWAALKLLRVHLNANEPTPAEAAIIADYLRRAGEIVGVVDTLSALDAEVMALISQMPPEDQMLLTDFWNRLKVEDLAGLNDTKLNDIKLRVTYILAYAKNMYLEYI